MSSCFCGSGKKHKRCHKDINEDSILAYIMSKYAYLDKFSTSSYCRQSCNDCCYDFFYISEREFLGILYYIKTMRGEDYVNQKINMAQENLMIFKREYPEKYNELNHPIMTQKIDARKAEYFLEKMADDKIDGKSVKISVPCVFLNDQGKCDIYSVRPLVCRIYGSFLEPKRELTACDYQGVVDLPILNEDNLNHVCETEILDAGIIDRNYPIMDWLGFIYPRIKNKPLYIQPNKTSLEDYIKSKTRGY